MLLLSVTLSCGRCSETDRQKDGQDENDKVRRGVLVTKQIYIERAKVLLVLRHGM